MAWGTCENCRFETRVDDAPSVAGDRIYTMKKGVELPFVPAAGRVGPGRWEVAVFKLPEEPEVRYIKRLVGMPEEVIRIQQGDLWRTAARRARASSSGSAGPSGISRRCRSRSMMIPTVPRR